jgi:hypothetical protein
MLFFRERIGQSVHGSVMTLQAGQERNPLIPATGCRRRARKRSRQRLDRAGARIRQCAAERRRRGCPAAGAAAVRTRPGGGDFVDGGTLSFSLLPYLQAPSRCWSSMPPISMPRGQHRAVRGRRHGSVPRHTRRRTVHEVGLIDLLDMARLQDCLPAGARCCASSPPASTGAKRCRHRCCGHCPMPSGRRGRCCGAGTSCESPDRDPDPDRVAGPNSITAPYARRSRIGRRRHGHPCRTGRTARAARQRRVCPRPLTCAACR